MTQAQRIAELERRLTQLEAIVAQLCEDAVDEDDDGPTHDLSGAPIPRRDRSATSL